MRYQYELTVVNTKVRLLHFTRYCCNSVKARWAKLQSFTSSFL